jgi:hypothetical protein
LRPFKNIKLQEAFDRDGYVIVDLIDENTIQRLYDYFLELNHDLGFDFYTSIWSDDKGYRKKVNEFVTAQVFEKTQEYLNKYKPVFANYMVKKPKEHSALGFHQDWTFTLEGESPAMNFWFPLSSVNKENGSLKVIPGSHKLAIPIRARNFPSPLERLSKRLLEKNAIVLSPKLGQAVVFHEKLIHSSAANKSDKLRLAASIVLTSEESTLTHIIYRDGKLLSSMIHPDLFTEYGLFDDLKEQNFTPIIDNNTKYVYLDFMLKNWMYKLAKTFS